MSARDDGGPAFPVAKYDHQTFTPNTVDEMKRLLSGMSLRDHFAGLAMAAMIGGTWPDSDDRIETARRSYLMADAMLAERAK